MSEDLSEESVAPAIECSTLFRTVRPLRSRLQTLSRSMLLPSFAIPTLGQLGVSQGSSAALSTSDMSLQHLDWENSQLFSNENHANLNSSSTGSACSLPLRTPVRRTYRRGGNRSQAPTTTRQTLNLDKSPGIVNPFKQQAEFARKYPGIPTPIRKHAVFSISTLKSTFREAFQRGRTSCSSYHPNHHRQPSLASLAAYRVGESMENLEEVVDQMAVYELIPAHHRRTVMLQHLTSLCAQHINILPILNELIHLSFSSSASYQMLTFIRYACRLGTQISYDTLKLYYNYCVSMRKVGVFRGILMETSAGFPSHVYFQFCHFLTDPELCFALQRFAMEKILDRFLDGSEGENGTEDCLGNMLKPWVASSCSKILSCYDTHDTNIQYLSEMIQFIHALCDYNIPELRCCIELVLLHCDRISDDGIEMIPIRESYMKFLFFTFGNLSSIFGLAERLFRLGCAEKAKVLVTALLRECRNMEKSDLESAISIDEVNLLRDEIYQEIELKRIGVIQDDDEQAELCDRDEAQQRYFDSDLGEWLFGTPPPAHKKQKKFTATIMESEGMEEFFDSVFIPTSRADHPTPMKQRQDKQLSHNLVEITDDNVVLNLPDEALFSDWINDFVNPVKVEAKQVKPRKPIGDILNALSSPKSGIGMFH